MSLTHHNNLRASTYAFTGPSLASALEKALIMQKDHRKAFEDHHKTFDNATVAKWEKMIKDWEEDPQKPNPFEEPDTCKYEYYDGSCATVLMLSIALNTGEVRLELAKEDAADVARGVERGHDTTPSKFLMQGLDLEDQQYVVLLLVNKCVTNMSHKLA